MGGGARSQHYLGHDVGTEPPKILTLEQNISVFPLFQWLVEGERHCELSLLQTQCNNNDTMKNNKTAVSFSLFQWMVDGQIGLRGHHAVIHVEVEYSRERGNVQIHPRPTVEQAVRETRQRSDPAI